MTTKTTTRRIDTGQQFVQNTKSSKRQLTTKIVRYQS